MSNRLNITIDDDVFDFVQEYGRKNRSAFINKMLREAKRRRMEEDLIQGLKEDFADPAYRQEIADWDVTVGDGLSDED